MNYGNQLFVAGAFVSQAGRVNSFAAIYVGSQRTTQLQVDSVILGSAAWRGIATVNSGTNVVSVSAAAARSGAVIHVTPYMYANAVSSGQNLSTNFIVASVRAGAFEIFAAGSVCPTAACPVAWSIVQ